MTENLVARGYRRTSRRHGMVSRVDRPDWKEVLAKHLIRSVPEMEKMVRRSPGDWEDYYRRVLSKDTITLNPPSRALSIPSSDHDPVGYVP